MTLESWSGFLDKCPTADRVVLVAPYIKQDALRAALKRVGSQSTIECFTRWTPRDIYLGASDVDCRTLIKSRGGSFRLHGSLHAKYYRADDLILIGSANLTPSGLGLTASPNLEILTEVSSPAFDWLRFERRLLRESRELTDEEFALWEQCPVSEDTLPDSGFPSIDLSDWKPQTRQPEYLWVVYSGSSLPSNDQYDLAMADLAALQVPSDLDQGTFDQWVASALSLSEFVTFVVERLGENDHVLWDAVCEEWGVPDRAAAARLVQTVENWTQSYRP